MTLRLLLMLLQLHPCLSSDSLMIITPKYNVFQKEGRAGEKRPAGGPQTFLSLKPFIGPHHMSKILNLH